jgi:hypothetical protein
MNRSSGPSKTASNLPESIHQRLNIYALAAGAAGVSVLALVQASAAKIVYTPANIFLSAPYSNYHLDLNQDGITDFVFSVSSGRCGKLCFFKELRVAPARRDGVETNQSGPAALSYGARIGEMRRFDSRAAAMFHTSWTTFGYHVFGNWHKVTGRYLGLKFLIHGKYHFGWARLTTTPFLGGVLARLTGYAYETIAGKSIIAGKTHGKVLQDSLSPDDPGSGASLTSLIPDAPQPASLGMLALGAQGVPIWRRKETQEVIGQ